jgi:hypothetical protein
MFICIVLLIVFLPVALLPLTLKRISPDELMDMGIYLENPQTLASPDSPTRPANSIHSCPSCLSSGLPV